MSRKKKKTKEQLTPKTLAAKALASYLQDFYKTSEIYVQDVPEQLVVTLYGKEIMDCDIPSNYKFEDSKTGDVYNFDVKVIRHNLKVKYFNQIRKKIFYDKNEPWAKPKITEDM